MTSTLRFGRYGRVMVLHVGEADPAAGDWRRWVESYSSAIVEHGVRSLLVVSRGGGPNARQQSELRSAIYSRIGREAINIRTAVCGDRVSVRLVTRAIGWLMSIPYIQSFRGDAHSEALSYLGVPKDEHPRILEIVERCSACDD